MLRLRHVATTSASTLISGGLSLAVAVAAARLLGPEQNGHYAQYVIVLNLTWLVLSLGLAPAVTYFLASGQMSRGAAHSFNQRFLLWAVFAAVVVLAGLGGAGVGAQIEDLIRLPSLLLALGLVGGIALLAINQMAALYMGTHEYDRANLISVLRTGVPLPAIAAVCAMWPTASAAAAAQTLAVVATAAWAWLDRVADRTSWDAGRAPARSLLGYGAIAYASNVLHYIAIRGLLLGYSYYATPAEVGYANLALLLLEAVLLVPSSIGQLLFPQSSGASFEPLKIESLLRFTLMLALVVALLVGLGAPLLATLVLGERYRPVGTALLHVAPSIVLMAIPRILSPVLSGQGRPLIPLFGATASVLVGTPLALWLMPAWGLNGTMWVFNAVSVTTAVVILAGYTAERRISWIRLLVPSRADIEQWLYVVRRVLTSSS